MNNKPKDIEAVSLIILSMFFFGCYVLPKATTINHSRRSAFIIAVIDSFINRNPSFDVVLCGDLNRLDIVDTCDGCKQIRNKPTYGYAEMDYMVFSTVLTSDPFDLSTIPNASPLRLPVVTDINCRNDSNIFRPVYNLRESQFASFLIAFPTVIVFF